MLSLSNPCCLAPFQIENLQAEKKLHFVVLPFTEFVYAEDNHVVYSNQWKKIQSRDRFVTTMRNRLTRG